MSSNGGNFLTGPVALSPAVVEAYHGEPISHRNPTFRQLHETVCQRLHELTGAREIALLHGSGTLANDAIACQLRNLGRGVILVNGEFGERLIDHAARWDLDFTSLAVPFGCAFDFAVLERGLLMHPPLWIWAVHCETSSGVVNDLDALRALAFACDSKLILDCVSSIGAIETDLDGVCMASGVSGKALGAPAGVAMVFAEKTMKGPAPAYLDLERYWRSNPFTFPSNLLAALDAALAGRQADHFVHVAKGGRRLRGLLSQLGYTAIASIERCAPHVLTFRCSHSRELGRDLDRSGFRLAYESDYLARRNLMQACLMGAFEMSDINALADAMPAYRVS